MFTKVRVLGKGIADILQIYLQCFVAICGFPTFSAKGVAILCAIRSPSRL